MPFRPPHLLTSDDDHEYAINEVVVIDWHDVVIQADTPDEFLAAIANARAA
jgi:hypothetical protein